MNKVVRALWNFRVRRGVNVLTDSKTYMRLSRWNKETVPSLEALRAALTGEGFAPTQWTDPPGTVYPVHADEYAMTRWVLRGQMRIGLPESGEEFILKAGDRIDLPPGAPYWIDVNGNGPVIYLIGTRQRTNGHHKNAK